MINFAPAMKHLLTVFILLVTFTCCTTEADRNHMRAGLDSINVRNRTGQPFTVDDVQPYVTFFDEHGTPNDRVLAHYLLGRAYHEHGEAPMALKYYQEAIDCADTATADCDYSQLAKVYGQMSDVLYDQGLYRDALYYDSLSVKIAWRAKDTIVALTSYEQEGFAYLALKDTTSAMAVIDEVAQKYLELGYPSDAAITLGTIIRPLIDIGQYDKARKYIDLYESLSGRFDSCGNIETGREIYYNVKGQYFFLTAVFDSAEYYFRKELNTGKDFNNQNAASLELARLYHILHLPDSAAKFAVYAYDMLDSLYAQRTTEEIEHIQAMYDYTRYQEVARQESENAALANRKVLISFLVFLAVLLIASWLYIARKKVIENLQKTVAELETIKKENYKLKCDVSLNQHQITENEKRIRQLENKLGRYGKLVYFGSDKTENNLKLSMNYQLLKDRRGKEYKLNEAEWDVVRNLVDEYFPGCYDFIVANLPVDSLKYKICLLLRLHFINKEIGPMIGYTDSYSSKLSSEIYKELYGKEGGSKELTNKLAKLF